MAAHPIQLIPRGAQRPNDPALVDQALYFQTITFDSRANALGLTLTAGQAVVLLSPGN